MQDLTTHKLTDFRPVRHWIADEAGSVFKTFSSFEWFLRRHRGELIASGEFIPRNGAAGSLCGPGLGVKVLEILRREAQQTADASKAA